MKPFTETMKTVTRNIRDSTGRIIGEMHPALLELFGVTDPISLGEINISALLQVSS